MIDAVSISGPSGIGKATLCQCLIELWPGLFAVVPSACTREGKLEVHGKIYKHVSHMEFEALIKAEEFLEYNMYPTKNGGFNYYGSLCIGYKEIISLGKIPLFDIDINGAEKLKQKLGNKLLSIALNGEIEEIEQRLRSRGSEKDEKDIQARINAGKLELEKIPKMKEGGIIDEVVWYGKGCIPAVTANKIVNFLPKKQALV